MWLILTNMSDSPVIVDMSKVTNVQAGKSGTQVQFEATAKSPEGKDIPRTVIVRESVEQIARYLKAKRVA